MVPTEPEPLVVLKESYFRRLRRFFDAMSLEGPTFEGRCNMFVQNGRQDPNWALLHIEVCHVFALPLLFSFQLRYHIHLLLMWVSFFPYLMSLL